MLVRACGIREIVSISDHYVSSLTFVARHFLEDSFAILSMLFQAVEADASETLHLVTGFRTIPCCNQMWKFLGKCKTLAKLRTMLMVKVVLFPRWSVFPSHGARTRYPCYPRKSGSLERLFGLEIFTPKVKIDSLQLHLEFSGTDLSVLLQAVKCAFSWSLRLLGRVPDHLSQRIRETTTFLNMSVDFWGQCRRSVCMRFCPRLGRRCSLLSYRSAYLYISNDVSFHLHAVLHCRHLLRAFGGRASLWRTVVEFLCPEAVEVLALSQAMSLGVLRAQMVPVYIKSAIDSVRESGHVMPCAF